MMKSCLYVLTLFVIIGAFHVALNSAECCRLLCENHHGPRNCSHHWYHCTDPGQLINGQTCCDAELKSTYKSLQADSLTLDLTYPDRNSGPTLTAEWAYAYDTSTVPSDKVKVLIMFDGVAFCFYLNNTATTVTMTNLPNPLQRSDSCGGYNVTVEVLIGQQVIDNNIPVLTDKIHVGDCWSVMGNRSLDVCGVQVPSPPVNVSAVLSVNCSTNQSTFTVEWSPPLHHNTPIEKYYIELYSAETKIISEWISPSVTKYSVTDRNTTAVRSITAVMVAAAVNLTQQHCEPCCRVITSEVSSSPVSYYFRPPPTITVSPICIPSSSSTDVSTTSKPTVPVVLVGAVCIGVGFVVIVFVVVVVLMVLAVTLRKKRFCRGNRYFSFIEQLPVIPDVKSIFIVASTEEDDGMQYKLRYLVHDLADNGIESVYYEYERTSHGPESPAALGISQWVELQFQKCDLVLFAFTKRFLEEWKRESTDQLSPVVWSSRHVLDGLLPHQSNISKFGVVLMGEDCTIPPGLKRFQVFRLFNGDSPTIHSEHLIRYILETPPYAPQRVSTM